MKVNDCQVHEDWVKWGTTAWSGFNGGAEPWGFIYLCPRRLVQKHWWGKYCSGVKPRGRCKWTEPCGSDGTQMIGTKHPWKTLILHPPTAVETFTGNREQLPDPGVFPLGHGAMTSAHHTLQTCHSMTKANSLTRNSHIQIGPCRAEPSDAEIQVQQTRGTTWPLLPLSGHSAHQRWKWTCRK